MAYDQVLADRIRAVLDLEPDVGERAMFGGLAFMVGGHMACGVVRDDLIVRVGVEGYADALAHEHVRPFDFTGRPSRGMVYVGPGAVATVEQLAAWVSLGLRHARMLPTR